MGRYAGAIGTQRDRRQVQHRRDRALESDVFVRVGPSRPASGEFRLPEGNTFRYFLQG